MRFVCPNRWVARALAKGQTEPVYRFLFARQPATNKGPLPASHGIELTYVFGSLNNIAFFTPDAQDIALSEAMMRYWTGFATTGAPNTASDPAWPQYNGAAAQDNEPYLVLDAPISTGEHLRDAQCNLWDQISDQLGVLPAGAQ